METNRLDPDSVDALNTVDTEITPPIGAKFVPVTEAPVELNARPPVVHEGVVEIATFVDLPEMSKIVVLGDPCTML